MRRRRLVLFTLASALVSLALLFADAQFQRRVRIDRGSFDAIQTGMTEGELVQLIGGPPGDYRTGEVEYILDGFEPGDTSREGSRLCRWVGDRGIINVVVADGRMVSATFYTGRRQPLSLLSNLWRRLGL